jgi:hypothetical protein
MSRKRCKRKVWPLLASPVGHVIARAALLAPAAVKDMELRALEALEDLAKGRGAETGFDLLSDSVNLAGCLAHDQAGLGVRVAAEGLDLAAAKQAIRDVWARYGRTGKIGATGPELAVLRDTVRCLMDTLPCITQAQFDKAVIYLKNRSETGECEVLSARPDHTQAELALAA